MALCIDGWNLIVRNTFLDVDEETWTPVARRPSKAKTWAAVRASSFGSTEDEGHVSDGSGADRHEDSSGDGMSVGSNASEAAGLVEDGIPASEEPTLLPTGAAADCQSSVLQVSVRNTFVHVFFEDDEEVISRPHRLARTWSAKQNCQPSESVESSDSEGTLADQQNDVSALQELRVACEDLPSIGSVGHFQGTCKPCAFGAAGCRNGKNCEFCHLCQPVQRKKHGRWVLKRRKQAAELHGELMVRRRVLATSENAC